MSKLLLDLELIPVSNWKHNVRDILSKKQWNYLKSLVASRAYNMCEICGGIGPKHPVECHEIFSYDDKNFIQKLEGMIALCPNCHMVKHMGFAKTQGREQQAIQHFRKVNKLTLKEANLYIKQAFKTWVKRSENIWKLDLSHLKEYGLDIIKINEEDP